VVQVAEYVHHDAYILAATQSTSRIPTPENTRRAEHTNFSDRSLAGGELANTSTDKFPTIEFSMIK
jgi:hypothetical protein